MTIENKIYGYITDSLRLQFVMSDGIICYLSPHTNAKGVIFEVVKDDWICDIYVSSENPELPVCVTPSSKYEQYFQHIRSCHEYKELPNLQTAFDLIRTFV